MTTSKQESDFLDAVMPLSFLDSVIQWLTKNLHVADVYEPKDIKKYVADNCLPDEVFSESQLKEWAANYFQKEESVL